VFYLTRFRELFDSNFQFARRPAVSLMLFCDTSAAIVFKFISASLGVQALIMILFLTSTCLD